MTGAPTNSVAVAPASSETAWSEFVEAHPDATGYHEWGWRPVFERVFGHVCHYLVATDGRSGKIIGVLPLVEIRSLLFGRTLTSLPFVNFGGVLSLDPSAEQPLVDAAADLARTRGCRHVELRHVGRHFPDLPCKQHKVTMRLSLGAGMWERIDRKARNQVRKAQKSNLTVERGGAELVTAFYEVFARNMRDLGTPVYPIRFFDEVMRAFPSRTAIIVVRLGGKPVAAGLTYGTRNMTEIPWASSIREFNSLCPNHLLYWHAIETAVAEGVSVFDFGRSTPGEGTFKFKEQWGAVPVDLHWEYWLSGGGDLPDQSPKNPKFRLAIETWKHLPLWAANSLGPRVVRGIP